jgi:hypothetical protein
MSYQLRQHTFQNVPLADINNDSSILNITLQVEVINYRFSVLRSRRQAKFIYNNTHNGRYLTRLGGVACSAWFQHRA